MGVELLAAASQEPDETVGQVDSTERTEGTGMSDKCEELLREMIGEMRAVRSEIVAIRDDIGVLVSEQKQSTRMQSPLVGRDLFHMPDGSASPDS